MRFDRRTGVEVIERRECLELLATDVVGRVAVVEGTGPLVLPVNYALHGEQVVFRTGPGSKLAASRGRQVCFEVDSFDRLTRSGWSVVVRGRLEEVGPFDRSLAALEHLAEPWLGTEPPNIVRVVPTVISGRRVRPPAAPPGGRGVPMR
jgi:nitroimidazol reductase NimA-like FMN-containing flavoprotein (pyridoxamine 5'-phosphate oxidase superfamily)